MNINLILDSLNILGGQTKILSTEETVLLHNSLLILQNENHFRNVFFWGRLMGTQKDYYIAYGYVKDVLLGQIFYYSTNCMDWGRLPPASELSKTLSQICTSTFSGDPSLIIDVLCEKDDPLLNKMFDDKNVICKLKEEDRLSATVNMINEEGRIVPRGGLFKRPDSVVVENLTFEGLTELEARDQVSYLHFRQPRFKMNTNLLTRKDYNYAIDFLDTIDMDVPNGSWSIKIYNGSIVFVESLYWPGMLFFHEINTPKYGSVYLGHGKKNVDIPFMVFSVLD